MPTNINIGVLGHVDAGKTALVRALSTQGSTASFDKHPQSAERGITLDLGFSSCLIDAGPELTGKCTKVRLRLPATLTVSEPGVESDKLQVTWVDCPGHASLVRTVLASVRIIDMALVVVDATKGFQTQTGESLVLCELATSHVIIVLSKVDLLPQQERMAAIEKITARVRKTLSKTKFADASIVPTTVKPSGEMSDAEKALYAPDAVTKCISKLASVPVRSPDGPFLCLIDHCFLIKGQGTIATGTVIGGSVRVGDMVEIPVLGVSKKVKSIQVFRRPVKHAQQGDRVGICLGQMDSADLERGIVCTPSSVQTSHAFVCTVQRIRFFKRTCSSGTKFHVTLGNETMLATAVFFKDTEGSRILVDNLPNWDTDVAAADPDVPQQQDTTLALLRFDKPIFCPPNAAYIASRLDMDIHDSSCRMAFQGNVVALHSDGAANKPAFAISIPRSRQGRVERILDANTVLVEGAFNSKSAVLAFADKPVVLLQGQIRGTIQSPFGLSGKFKAFFTGGHMLPLDGRHDPAMVEIRYAKVGMY
ncbi:hypothetical protein HK105_200963 [Polyrhizophydium stewartii]|uniref:Tr-type G domain-containing protein n=1 Tax=Polyrhizophydium stewartii TaxID=2732419 RepID=A0ABR4NIM8_9FUNG